MQLSLEASAYAIEEREHATDDAILFASARELLTKDQISKMTLPLALDK